MKVEIWFDRSSVAIEYVAATATYQKGDFLCVRYDDRVDKYPVDHIFKVTESNFVSSQPRQ